MIFLDSTDTIAAIASPSGQSVRGIIRLSGGKAVSLAFDSFDFPLRTREGRASRIGGYLRVAGLRSRLVAALIVWPDARSYTGEPSVEIHTLGSPPILQAILQDLISRGARLAEPGEFTLRAFLSGRIDLTRAEAVLAIIKARHPLELDVALAQLAGESRSRSLSCVTACWESSRTWKLIWTSQKSRMSIL